MSQYKRIFFSFYFCFFSTLAVANEGDGGCKALVFDQLNYLPHQVESYPFRVWYATEGKNALSNVEYGEGKNTVPTVIEDLLLQLHSADRYFSQELGLTPPLLQQRYRQAEFIDVHLVAMEKGNGLAFDEVIAEKSSKDAESHSCGIKIHINSTLQPSRNITPAHELFHLYQYANTMFKTRWYLEGMARWTEQAFRGVSANEVKKSIPGSCTEVLNESYGAERYWRNLAARLGSDDIVLEPEYRSLRYSDGSAVFNTSVFKNGAAVKEIFDRLAVKSHQVALEQNLPQYLWPEAVQRSSQFDVQICEMLD